MLSVNGGNTLDGRLTAAIFLRNQMAFQSDEIALIVRGVMEDDNASHGPDQNEAYRGLSGR